MSKIGLYMENAIKTGFKSISRSFISSVKQLSKVRLALLVLATVIEILSLAVPGDGVATLAMLACVIVSGYLIYESRNNWTLVIVYAFIAYSCYSILCAVYLGVTGPTPYRMFANSPVAWEGASVMLAFVICLGFTTPAFRSKTITRAVKSDTCDAAIVLICAALLLYYGLTGLTDSGSARASINSTLYEYSIVFLIVGLYYAADDKRALLLLMLVIIFRIYVDFSTGNRVTALEMMTVFFLMRLAHRARWKYVIPIAFGLFLALMAVGALRGSDFSVSEIAAYFYETVRKDALAWDGGYAAYHASLCVLSYEGLIDPFARIAAFPGYLLSISVNFMATEMMYDPVALARTEYWHMGGCYFPFHFHFYLGMFGVVMASVLLGAALRYFNSEKLWLQGARPVTWLVAVWVGATSFRWIQYSPIQLLRGVAVIAIVSAIASVLHGVLRRRSGRGLKNGSEPKE